MFELIRHDFQYDFLRLRHRFAWGSLLVCIASIVLLFVKGPNWSIDFTGGTEVELSFELPTTASEVQEALSGLNVGTDAVQSVGDAGTHYILRMQGQSAALPEDVAAAEAAVRAAFSDVSVTPDEQVGTRLRVNWPSPADGSPSMRSLKDFEQATAGLGVSVQASPEENTVYLRLPGLAEQVRAALEVQLGDRKLVIERAESVGPKVGESLRVAGLSSLAITMIILLIYVGFRFDFTFGPGAVLCVFHDSAVLIGIWVLTGQEFGLSMISAVLTLLGYSINDTIVVYDRIRENSQKYRAADFGKLINDSINQTLSRTVVTNGATMLSLVPFLFLGGPVLKQFASALLVGILIGTYSTIYVAAPLTLVLRDNRQSFLRLLGLKG